MKQTELNQLTKEEFIEFISKNYLDKLGKLKTKKIKENSDLLNLFYKFTNKIPNKEKYPLRYLWWCIRNNFNEIPKCKTCKKEIPLKIEFANPRYPEGYVRRYCSLKCFNDDPEIKEKARERERKRAQERLEKRKKTVEEKYGSWENRPGKDNFKKANEKLKKDPEFRQKRKEKTINTNLEKYGAEWPTQTQEIKEKRKQTSLKKYGVEHWFKLYNQELAKRNVEKNVFEKFNFDSNLQKQWIDKEFWLEKFLKNNKINIFAAQKYFKIDDYMVIYNHFRSLLKDEFNNYSTRSQYQDEITDYIKSFYDGEIIQNDRQTIAPLELDIFVPEKKVAIEFDGLYWHSFNDKNLVNEFKFKHLYKTMKAEEKGINLLHIFENEWINPLKRDIWKSVIAYKLSHVKNRYYARKLKITTVDNKFAKYFFHENHLQGGAAVGSYRLALYEPETGKIISIMTFSKPRYNKEIEYELIRFASLKYTACVGCAQKLFKHFIKNYNPKSIVSYANRRWASKHSNLYKTLGFEFVGEAEPNYFYFKLDDPELRMYPRVTFQKHKLKDHPATKDYFNPELTETEIMFNAGFRRIYDCGNLVFHWKKDKK